MNETVKLEPALVFEQFAEINKIPRPSKHEEKMIEYLKEFGAKFNLSPRAAVSYTHLTLPTTERV